MKKGSPKKKPPRFSTRILLAAALAINGYFAWQILGKPLQTEQTQTAAGTVPAEVQERLESIVSGFSKDHDFKDWSIYSTKHGRVISSMIYVVLRHDTMLHQVDALRTAMLKAIHESWSWSDTDIVFCLDSSWMRYAIPAAPEEATPS